MRHEEGELAAEQQQLAARAALLEQLAASRQAQSEHDGRFAAMAQQCVPLIASISDAVSGAACVLGRAAHSDSTGWSKETALLPYLLLMQVAAALGAMI